MKRAVLFARLKSGLRTVGLAFFFGFAVWVIVPSETLGAVPQLISFQGVLRDGSGNPVADGVYTVRFRIYDDSTTAEANFLWSETVPVQTIGGLFTVRLGDDTPLPNTLFTGGNRFVGVKVNVDPEMTPRTRLISVPYAFHALRSDSAATATVALDLTCTGCVDAGDLAADAVGADEIAAGAVGTSEIDATQVQRRVTGTAPANEYITAINQDGSVTTAADVGSSGSGWMDDGTTVRLLDGADSVGVGTTTPTKKLEVAGSIKADSVFSNVLSSNSPLSLQAPVGATRMFISDISGDVGIGTTTLSPVSRLHIRKDINGVAGLNIENQDAGTSSSEAILFSSEDGLYQAAIYVYDVSDPGQPATMRLVNNLTGGNFDFLTGGAARMNITNSGNVGIGNTNPAQKLDVAGTAQMTGIKLTTAPATGRVLTSDATGVGTWQALPASSGWNLTGNSGTTPGTNFLGTTDNQALELHVNNVQALRLEPASGFPNLIGGIGHSVTAGAFSATIAGGTSNSVTDNNCVVGGGVGNRAGDNDGIVSNTQYATVGGGASNIAGDDNATVGGGNNNQATNISATVAGGNANRATGQNAMVGGGQGDSAMGINSVVAGGSRNTAFGNQSAVGGGSFNYAGGAYSTVGGGTQDTANALYATVAGGVLNQATANSATVGGGQSDTASANLATVPGGYGNKASGQYSFAAGNQAKAVHNGSFVWSDNQGTAFASTNTNQFSIRAQNGLRLADSAGAAKTVAIGEHYKDNGIVAWGRVIGATGVIAGEYGVTSVTRTGAGSYNVTINAAAFSSAHLVPTVTALSPSGTPKIINASVTGASTFSVFTYTTGAALSDTDFSFIVTAR